MLIWYTCSACAGEEPLSGPATAAVRRHKPFGDQFLLARLQPQLQQPSFGFVPETSQPPSFGYVSENSTVRLSSKLNNATPADLPQGLAGDVAEALHTSPDSAHLQVTRLFIKAGMLTVPPKSFTLMLWVLLKFQHGDGALHIWKMNGLKALHAVMSR